MYDMSRTNISVSFKRIKIILQLLLSSICASLVVGLLLQLHIGETETCVQLRAGEWETS